MQEGGANAFAGDLNRMFRAFDANTGRILWETRLGTSVQGFPLTFTVWNAVLPPIKTAWSSTCGWPRSPPWRPPTPFWETEYWPEWNARFARPVQEFPNQHRPLTPYLDLAAILCHVEHRVIGNDYTFSFAGRRYQIAREEAQAGMRHQRLRVELRLNGDLQARYQDRYLHLGECGAKPIAPPLAVRKPVRKDHNAGGKSAWMQDFFDRPSPPLWKLIGD